MSIKTTITVTGLDEVTSSMLALQSTEVRRRAINAGANDALVVVKKYYGVGGSALWSGTGPTQGAGRKKTQWWRKVESNWAVASTSSTGATLSNINTDGFSHKITGGTISAKRAKFLTIPIVPEAHGLSAKTYSKTIKPLFRVKNLLVQSEDNGKIKPIFVLKKSVTQKPWKGALPPEKTYLDAYAAGVLDTLIAESEK
jgi:hypothetical protein